MRNILLRSTVAVVATSLSAVASLVGAGIGSADPLNCPTDSSGIRSPTPARPAPCGELRAGDYWNPLSNVCRPLGSSSPNEDQQGLERPADLNAKIDLVDRLSREIQRGYR